MSYDEVSVWLADGANRFKVSRINHYRQALKEFDKNPYGFDTLTHRNAEELRKKL